MILPTDLIQKIQNDYVHNKYKDGVFTFLKLDDDVLKLIITSFLDWAEQKKLIKDQCLDLTDLIKERD
jgi:hypothetical protein